MLIGSADGTGKSAEFAGPAGIAIGPDGNIYVVDTYSSRIRKITPSGVVTTIAGSSDGYADGMGTEAKFYRPKGIAISPNGTMYIADYANSKIRTISPSGVVSTLTGGAQGYVDGTLSEARFNGPEGLELASDGTLYVVESFGNRVRKISTSGIVTTLAGKSYPDGSTPGGRNDGTGLEAEFYQPIGIAISADGSLYVSDYSNSKIRKITAQGVVTTISGSPNAAGYLDGPIATARFSNPVGLAVASDGTLFICDTMNDRIRTISPAGEVKTFAGIGPGNIDGDVTTAKFLKPYDIAISKEGVIYVTDGTNHAVRKITVK
jgi:sugar lactone lactonase YvrE